MYLDFSLDLVRIKDLSIQCPSPVPLGAFKCLSVLTARLFHTVNPPGLITHLNGGFEFNELLQCPDGRYVHIDNDVWIGRDVTIKGGVTIDDGAVIGANALVTEDVPPYAIVGGVPAKLIRYRFTEDGIRFLLSLKWWNWDDGKLAEYAKYSDSVSMLREALEKGS